MPPETQADVVSAFLGRVERRVWIADLLRGASAGGLMLAGVALVATLARYGAAAAWIVAIAVGAATAALLIWGGRAGRTGDAVGALIERALPDSRNVIFTARELMASPQQVAPWMQQRVIAAAAAVAGQADAAVVVPLRRDAALAAVAIAAVVAMAVGLPQRTAGAARVVVDQLRTAKPGGAAAALTVTARIEPPAYTGAPAQTLVDPPRLEVVQGSRVVLSLGHGAGWQVRFGSRPMPLAAGVEPQIALVATESGYFAIERADGGERRLLPVTVTPDRAATVRLEAPGKDLLLPDARVTIPVAAVATDDFGLRSLDVRYTKVSGSGEQFEFVEGTLPVAVTRDSARAWKAAGRFDLAGLKLEPGDSLVYHAVARDGRAGESGASASDTYFIEIAGPGQVALPGFELPPDHERYALSQQMIVIKLQRLRAREKTLAREMLEQEVATIAAEQRAVRANFIFLMGGHVEDEEEEAEHSNEIQEGRLENSARREISTAIKFMGDAEQAMAAVDTGAALPPAQSAVAALQRAFGRNRYFLRTLAVRSRIDPTRRLTGKLDEAGDWRRAVDAATGDAKGARARALQAGLFDLASAAAGRMAQLPAERIAALAEDALAVDPGSADWQTISAALSTLRDKLAARRSEDELRAAFNAALAPLVRAAGANAPRGGGAPDRLGHLRGAWAEEARRR